MMKSVATAALIGLSLLVSTNASAVTVSLDPGNVGDMFYGFDKTFSDLNGTSLNGTPMNVDFVFSDMKHLKATSAAFPDSSLLLELTLHYDDFTGNIAFAPDATGYLSDELGKNILDLTNFFGSGLNNTEYQFTLSYTLALDQFIFHDIHFNITLPTIAERSVTSADLSVSVNDQDPNIIEVGQWSPVPEPGTLALFGLGLAGLGALRRRKARAA